LIKLLLVEDSAVQRELLLFVLEEAGGFDIVGTANNGEEAVKQAVLLRPDVILMDCHMPKMDGITATRVIMESCATPIVIATATTLRGDVQLTFDAIRNGALAVVNKPPAPGAPDFERIAGHLIRTLRLMSEVQVVRRWPVQSSAGERKEPASIAASLPPPRSAPVRIVAIVGSTGAPGVVADILAGIGPLASASVLVTQHMTEGFAEGFALWLAARSGLPATLAYDGLEVLPGCVYVAPDGAHMGISTNKRIVLSTAAEIDGFRPAGTALLGSVAAAFASRAIGVVLTGMGRDGAAGLLQLQRAGGVTIAQDEASSVVFGMPREAIRLGAATHVLPPRDIAQLIQAYANGKAE
jgi:two-component system chemotaxis response regulator CheB